MRWKWKSLAAVAALSASLAGFAAPSTARADVSVSVSFFHSHLAPYGSWVVAGTYGNVWVPGHVNAGWAPYVDGQWIYTDYGWTWVSDDPWGDIAYHYGTWAWAAPYGWVWVPGTVWAPAWVTWAYTDDYIGWAPVPPSFSLSVGGYVGAPIVVAAPRYVFVPSHQFVGVRVNTVRVAPQQNTAIFRRASKVTHFQVSDGIVRTTGLPEARVEKAVGRRVERVSIDRARTQPTTFERGGFEKAKSIPVVAPERERAKAAPAGKSDRVVKSEQSESRNAREARPQPQSAPPPERKAEVERKSAEPKAKPKAQSPEPEQREVQRSKPKAQSNEPEQREVQRSKPKAQSPEPEQQQVQRSKPKAQSPKPEQQQQVQRSQPSERVSEAPAPRPKSQARPEPPQKPVQEARAAEPKQNARPAPKPKPESKPKKAEKPEKQDKPDKPGQN